MVMASLFHTRKKYIKDVAHTHTHTLSAPWYQHSLACTQLHFFHHTIAHTFHILVNDTFLHNLTHNKNTYKLDMLRRA